MTKRELIRRRMKRLKSEMLAEGKSAKEILEEREEASSSGVPAGVDL